MRFLRRIWIAIHVDQLNQLYQERLKSLKNSNVSLSPQQKDEIKVLEKIEKHFFKLLLPSGKVPQWEIDELINKIQRCTHSNNEELSREVFQLFSYLDSSIAQEDNLLSQRLNLFLVAQTFLIAGYIQSFTLPPVNISFTFPPVNIYFLPIINVSYSLSRSLALGIAIIGFWTSIASDANLRLSIQSIKYYQDYYQQLKNEFSKHLYDFSLRPFKNRVSLYFGYYPDIYFDQGKQAKGFAKNCAHWLNWIATFFIVVWIILFLLVNIQVSDKTSSPTPQSTVSGKPSSPTPQSTVSGKPSSPTPQPTVSGKLN
jgi:hypothetical protein